MATFKIVVRYMRSDGVYPVYIRVTHNRKTKFINTGKVTTKKFIIAKSKEIKDPFVLQYCTGKIAKYATSLNQVDARKWDINKVVEFLEEERTDISFSQFAREYSDKLSRDGHARSASIVKYACQNLERFAGTEDIKFSQLTSVFIGEWIESLKDTARSKEQYPMYVRRIFNNALMKYNDYDSGVLKITTNPWQRIKIPTSDVPRKKAITMEDCRDFFNAPLPKNEFGRVLSLAQISRDVAMMSICLAGMNSVDFYKLKKENYNNGIISYERSKTRSKRADRAFFQIRVPTILKDIFERYFDDENSPYLFVFHKRFSSSESFAVSLARGMKQICEKSLGQEGEKPYSLYTFRHTWATIAQNECGASIEEVGFALNHINKNRVTRGYIKLDFTPAWELNEKVIEKIFFTEEKSVKYVDKEKIFENFSENDMMKATMYYKGKAIVWVVNRGFKKVDQIIDSLMDKLPPEIPSGVLVLIRVENVAKGQSLEYSRMVNR